VLAWQAPLLTAARRGPTPRAGLMLNGGAAYYQIYRAKDGRFVTLAATIERQVLAEISARRRRPRRRH
jgi:crotonobetainyl-CoA:carnitine CoA-transferase CaiB-like acyl-CoA transferase